MTTSHCRGLGGRGVGGERGLSTKRSVREGTLLLLDGKEKN